MNGVFLYVATGCYVLTAVDLFHGGNMPLALSFAAYAVANVGLIWAAYY